MVSNQSCNTSCHIRNIRNNCFSEIKPCHVMITAGLFWADGCLCVLFALLTQFKYARVTVLNYSICTPATSNMQWICFFLFTALSSIMNGLNLWYDKKKMHKDYPVITAWLADLLSVLSLVFAVKYQWQYRERAYDANMATTSFEERTPILPQQNGMSGFLRPSKADVFLVVLFLASGGFFIAAWTNGDSGSLTEAFYWAAHGVLSLLQLVIFVLILKILCTITQGGPSVIIKFALMAGVLCNALSDIPAYIWLNCILTADPKKGTIYAVCVGLILLSHVAFFSVMRTEFQRLKDTTMYSGKMYICHLFYYVNKISVCDMECNGQS